MTQVYEVLPNNPVLYLANSLGSQTQYDPSIYDLLTGMYPNGFATPSNNVLNSSVWTTEATRIQNALILYHHINTTSYVFSVGNTNGSPINNILTAQIPDTNYWQISAGNAFSPQMACLLWVKGGLQIPYSSNVNLYTNSYGLLFYGAFKTRIMLEAQPRNYAFSNIYVEYAQEMPMSQNPLAGIGQVNANFPGQTLSSGSFNLNVSTTTATLQLPTGVVISTNFTDSADQIEDQSIRTLISNIKSHNYLSVANMISINPLLWVQNAEFLFLLYRYIKTKQLSVQNI